LEAGGDPDQEPEEQPDLVVVVGDIEERVRDHHQMELRVAHLAGAPVFDGAARYSRVDFDVRPPTSQQPLFLVVPCVYGSGPEASMDPRSRDKWQPHRVPAVKAGARLLEIMADLKKQQHGRGLALAPVPQGPDVLLVHVVD